MEISGKMPKKITEHIGKAKLDIPREKITEFCQKHHIRRLSL